MRRFGLLVAGLVALPVLAVIAVRSEISSVSTDATSATGGARFSVLQMNLCLSGVAPCLSYPQVLREADAVFAEWTPDAVTLNEVCSGDVAGIARRANYHWRFTTVPYRGSPLPCTNPGVRGVFGNAVLTREAITDAVDERFKAQLPLEQRRWLCVTTIRRVSVCTTHLEPWSLALTSTVDDRQCAELARVLAARARWRPTIAAGDINRLSSCAPTGMWTLTDLAAAQKPGIQHVYGSAAHLLPQAAQVVPATSTDHDFLLVTARLAAGARP